MNAKVLYSHESKFNAPDGTEIHGFQTGVLYNDQYGKDRCREIWTRESFVKGSEANVIFSQKKRKFYLFKIEN